MGPNQGLGRMIREFGHERSGNAQPGDYYEDQKKEDFIEAEKNITLYASQRAVAVKMQADRIASRANKPNLPLLSLATAQVMLP